ncbi:unnamed protein product [Blumeria hordei]|uniref:Uncharacterized protein n=1 Tax=Blumeria hordei TaxID=2867405 RepID=A0A383UWZ9_BLUHO|nr:unnamed protein product [Blumeria hordei]
MRLTSLAVILQSASFFVTTFAVLTKRHVNEEDKGFNCDGREIWHEEYSRVDKLQLTGQATPMGLTLDNIYLNLLGNQAVDTTVTFGERENGGRRFSELITLWQKEDIYAGYFINSYILITNRNDRVNAMMKRTTFYGNNHHAEPEPEGVYSMCEILI